MTPFPSRSDLLKCAKLELSLREKFNELGGKREKKMSLQLLAKRINDRFNRSGKQINNFLAKKENIEFLNDYIGENASILDIEFWSHLYLYVFQLHPLQFLYQPHPSHW